MSKPKTTRSKLPAIQHQVPQTRDIRIIGELNREIDRAVLAMNDEIAPITERHQPGIDALKERLKALETGVHAWCEANRNDLTDGGKTKTANLITGEVSWRVRPPSVLVRGAEAVIDTLKRLGLSRFVRVEESVNKQAILNEPDAVRGVSGLTISSGVEDFIIKPFEQEAS